MSDAEVLFRWRNDAGSRANFNNTQPVLWEEHIKWLSMALADPNRKILIASRDGCDVATVRIDMVAGIRRVSWAVAPEYRFQGIGRSMLRQALAGEVNPLEAEIKSGNSPSMRIAEAAGFRMVSESDNMTKWRRD